MTAKIHIVLVHPKMPSNTGNIIRLCANTGASLHLLKPLGFELEDKKLRRAGLDYHEYVNLKVYENWHELLAHLTALNCQHIVALTTKQSQPFYEYDFKVNSDFNVNLTESNDTTDANNSNESSTAHIALIFGSETDGLPNDIRTDIAHYQVEGHKQTNNWLRLPMLPNSRSLNLSNSVAICLYEVWRQLGFYGDTGKSIGYEVVGTG